MQTSPSPWGGGGGGGGGGGAAGPTPPTPPLAGGGWGGRGRCRPDGPLPNPLPQWEGERLRHLRHYFGRKLVFSHFATSGTLGIFLLSYSHCARYCICAVCSFM
jgi:hypothetical protein